MPEFTRPLGDAVKRARGELEITQRQVAEAADVDVRTVLNIENYKGNPKLEVLYPLIRSLKIDSREVFYPELLRDSPGLRRLRLLVEDCNEEEALSLVPIIESILSAIRASSAINIKYNRKEPVSSIEDAGSPYNTIGSFFNNHLELYNIYQHFFPAFWTE